MTKVLMAIFVIAFSMTGCGIDSIFTGGAVTWTMCALITLLSGILLILIAEEGEDNGSEQ